MRKEEIKRIMIAHHDNDFIRVWDWIGKVLLMTLIDENTCGEKMLEYSEDIESFIHSLLPTAIEFTQYRTDKYGDNPSRYRDIDKEEVDRLSDYFKNVKFKYNFTETDGDWVFGGSETLIIDLEKNESYIH
jgi:hypothetical protein